LGNELTGTKFPVSEIRPTTPLVGYTVIDNYEEDDPEEGWSAPEDFEVPSLRHELSELARIERTHPISAHKSKGPHPHRPAKDETYAEGQRTRTGNENRST
jgi:hypothetical protein